MKTITPPNFVLILGAAKCATSSLYFYLNQHPDIYMSEPKEPLFFEKEYHKGIDYYWRKYFSGWNGENTVGEARHRNLYLPFVPPRIAESFPDAKLVVLLRNPTQRAYSHYLHMRAHGLEKMSFEEVLKLDMKRIEEEQSMDIIEIEKKYLKNLTSDGRNLYYRTYIDSGYYAEQIERYLQFFDKKQLFIIFLEDLKRNPQKVYSKLLQFVDDNLNLADVEIDFSIWNKGSNKNYEYLHRFLMKYPSLFKIMNSITPKHARFRNNMRKAVGNLIFRMKKEEKMNEDTRLWLVNHYREHNERLEELTGRDLSLWNK